ncbi:MAG: hypothetical protein WBO93_08875 [Gammaproteobacteria bacterium]
MSVFAAEQPIIDRIQAQVTSLAFVGSISALEVFETVPPLPSVIVRPLGSAAEDDPHDGAFQIETQTWEITLLVGHEQGDTTDTTTVSQAGTLIYSIMQALVGFRPATGYMAMSYRGRSDPYYEPGYGEFPILFDTGLVIQGLGN